MNPLDAMPVEDARSRIVEKAEGRPEFSLPLATVLLAEDDDDLRYVVECSLTMMGYRVVACADALLAASAFQSQPAVDILLTDFNMPGRSGLELARELTDSRPSLPVVILTGSVLSAPLMQEIHTRGWTYVSKPCHLSALESTMSNLLTAERYRVA